MSQKPLTFNGRISRSNHAHLNAVKRHDERLKQLAHIINHPRFQGILNTIPPVGRMAVREYLKDGATFVTVADVMNINPADANRYFKEYMTRIAKRLGFENERI